jgi:NitT/TauT family transport system ATP-binding protein/sulfonate transport system ATP-binding protein
VERAGELTGQPVIRCENISKEFVSRQGTIRVIDRLDLAVGHNEFVVLVGPGQSGKSTFINIVAGLEQATTGKIFISGHETHEPGPDRGVVYQKTALFPWLTVMGNVEFGPRMAGVAKAERRKKAQYYIDLVGLNGFEKSHPIHLSGGMRQRVGIARAYCNDPLVMLMDEPFGHLDAQTRYMMEEELERIWERERRTVVFVTNNIEEAVYLADRIVLFSDMPTTVKAEYTIDLPRPRNLVAPEFLALRQHIMSEMDKSR